MKRAENLLPDQAAADAVKAYLRIYRDQVANDAELLSLLLPERFGEAANVRDFQHFIIDKLRAENKALKSELSGLMRQSEETETLRESVRGLVLELLSARSFIEVLAIAVGAAKPLGADCLSLAVESAEASTLPVMAGVRLLPAGLVGSLIGKDAIGAVLRSGHEPLFAGSLNGLQSVAIFRLDLGSALPPALIALGANAEDCFEDECETREIAYFVRALERAIVAWLDPPKS
jgi:uncharacterized protein YigA (DUF484 family)